MGWSIDFHPIFKAEVLELPRAVRIELVASLSPLRVFGPALGRPDVDTLKDSLRKDEGLDPDDWKPMNSIGQGVREIRIREVDGAFRVVYVAKFADAVYVLHCFQKKSQKTSSEDVALATKRYKDLIRELKP